MADSGLNGKVALVTGGSRGIGRAIVERLAGDGVDVVFFYRGNADAARAAVDAVKTAGGRAEPMHLLVDSTGLKMLLVLGATSMARRAGQWNSAAGT